MGLSCFSFSCFGGEIISSILWFLLGEFGVSQAVGIALLNENLNAKS